MKLTEKLFIYLIQPFFKKLNHSIISIREYILAYKFIKLSNCYTEAKTPSAAVCDCPNTFPDAVVWETFKNGDSLFHSCPSAVCPHPKVSPLSSIHIRPHGWMATLIRVHMDRRGHVPGININSVTWPHSVLFPGAYLKWVPRSSAIVSYRTMHYGE